jgi:serine phosphatase RsbU (regulator of sigma subunit)
VYIDDRSFADIREDVLAIFNNNGIQVILPIYHERNLVGFICLGIKETLAGFRPEELEKLKYFSDKCNDFISTALTYQKATNDQLIARTIDVSSQIMKNALPSALPNIGNIKFGAFIHPKYSEGCDYFDFIRPGDQGVGVVVTDISGAGVNSALYSVLLRSAFLASVNLAPSTSTVIMNLNRIVYNYSKGKIGPITAFYLYYDIKSRRLMYTNAGYPNLEVFKFEKQNFDSLGTEGIPLGHDSDAKFGIARTDIAAGDIGILYSRSLVNSKNQKGDLFGLSKLRKVVMDFRTRGASDIAQEIKNSYEAFMGLSSPASDVVVLVFKTV